MGTSTDSEAISRQDDEGAYWVGQGVGLVVEERARQVHQGYTPEHDDKHMGGELLYAVRLLLLPSSSIIEGARWGDELARKLRLQHAADGQRLLVIAAAMLTAEIERLMRKEQKSEARGQRSGVRD